jgi:hypothetical protein
MLSQYGPDLLATCTNASDLSKTLVTEWLTRYMLKSDPNAAVKATAIGVWLADHGHFKTHGRPIPRAEARLRGLVVVDLESDQNLQDAVLSTYHSTAHSFGGTAAAKIIENHLGSAFLSVVMQPTMFGLPQMPQPISPRP